jgi:hypothetical protein
MVWNPQVAAEVVLTEPYPLAILAVLVVVVVMVLVRLVIHHLQVLYRDMGVVAELKQVVLIIVLAAEAAEQVK